MILKTGAQKIASFSCDEHERVPLDSGGEQNKIDLLQFIKGFEG